MKRIPVLRLIFVLCLAVSAAAQDAATEERWNKLSGQIEDLLAGQAAQQKRIAELTRELENLREQSSKPSANYATTDDLKRLADAIKEVDRKRMEDYDKMCTQLSKLVKTVSAPAPTPRKTVSASQQDSATQSDKPAPKKEEGYEYVIQQDDTLSAIVKAYRDKNIKITKEQILKANPGLVPEKMKPGQKIFIPQPQ
jgi:LysM repeat protein